ncbi:protein FAR-RED IMPAIRED RESPONSE 1-like [Lactuca sativa]|uniref:protein FAR-RED IMPAIRED RESPONSE 1-like n=1 Tax=Lactuca sativa TaxID=4236 RepID=UPI0022B021FE|nr:protein FAR-RED IMPAIRED RESPONSE 1-like [Lactuca sativa]
MSHPKEIDKSIATDTIIDEINSSPNDEQIDSISFTSEELQTTICIEGESSNSTNESYCSNIIEESEYKPDVPTEFVPVVNSVFKSLNLAVKMYTDYAEMASFHTRLSSQSKYNSQIIKEKYVICNRGGKDKPKPCDMLATSSVKRKPNSNKIITGCTTKIIFENFYGTTDYNVKKFFEMHNHPLESIEERPYTRKARKMSYSEKEFVVRASKAKIGPTMAHKIRVILKGGYEYVGAKVTNYKNLRRGVNRILCYKDAQIMINKMNDRRDHYQNYSFEFLCDGDLLAAMFWADEREKAFYAEFGEVISFDATFRTNKYKMVFVPFTAVDHHKKSVTAGAGLPSRETIESYEWLLKDFLRAHEGKAPKIVLTDQDAAIKQAITGDLFKNKDFKKRFNKLVWNMHIKPDEFEKKWDLIINEFNLEDKRWFNDMFELRDKWIPAYFSDTRMSGLMKTTSRSESMNSFFNTYSQSGNLLLNFMMNYDTAIQKQRNTQQELDHQTKKKEIYKEFEVEIKLPTNDVKCTCEHFNRFGTLCRHAFNILMKHGIKEIPEQYIENHWRKDVISRHYNFGRHVYDTGDSEINRRVNQAYYNFEARLEYVRKNKEKMDLFVKKTESMLKEYENDPTNELQKNRTDVEEVGKLMGITIPKDIDINVPNVQSNKGCGKKSRIQSAAEIAYKNSNKQTRRCSGCGERAPHNLRTCPIKLAAE